jgi:hypothetical protein
VQPAAIGVLRYGFVAEVISQLQPVEAVLEAAQKLPAERWGVLEIATRAARPVGR